jgi:hypothetical protein
MEMCRLAWLSCKRVCAVERLVNGAVIKENLVIRAGAIGCFYKPPGNLDLLGAVRKALKH